LSIAPLMAPHDVWPITNTTFTSQLAGELHAARISSLATLPATRALKQSPMPRSMIVSAGAGIDAAENDGGGILALRAHLLLLEIVVRRFLAATKTLIAFLRIAMMSSGVVVRCALPSAAEGKWPAVLCSVVPPRWLHWRCGRSPAIHVIAM
jgi:hypothetical protein